MSQQQSANPAEMYQQYLVPGIHARWTPVFLDAALQPCTDDDGLAFPMETWMIAARP